MKRAFTLTELIAVIVIIGVLASVLFPVFNNARRSGVSTSCIVQMRQLAFASTLYTNEYDDTFVPVKYVMTGSASALNDRIWPQLLAPYTRSLQVFRCPADLASRDLPLPQFDPDLVGGDRLRSFYKLAERTNYGYNGVYLARPGSGTPADPSLPATLGEIASPSQTLLFAETVWGVLRSGMTTGGGHYLAVPPCRYKEFSSQVINDTFESEVPDSLGKNGIGIRGWSLNNTDPTSTYGGLYPWHMGKIHVAFLDGSVRSFSPRDLARGCNLAANWGGTIRDSDAYLWDRD